MGEWRECSLGDLIELKRGYDLPQQRRHAGTVPIVSSSGVTDFHSEAMVRGPGVVTGRYGTLGQVYYIKEDFWPLNTTLYVRDFKGNDPRFVSFFLRSVDFFAYSDKAAVPGLNRNDLHQARILYPIQKEEQQEISSLLGALDDKIDLNRQMNESLEAMARLFFKDWFVDFGPTRVKSEGRPPYLAQELWSLFPSALDNEDKPAGWELTCIEDLAEQCKGSVFPGHDPTGLFEHYSLPAFDRGQQPAYDLGETIKSNKTPVPEGVVLLSKLNPETSRVWIPNDPSGILQVASTEFLIFKPKQPAGRSILYCLFRDPSFKLMLEGMVTGTSKSHQRISPQALLAQKVLYGSKDAFSAFEQMVSPIISQLLANRMESYTLAHTRDLLLPKLMSGEIRLREAEKIVEKVA